MSVYQEHTIAIQMPFATTLKDHLTVLVNKVIEEMVHTVKVGIKG